MVLVMVRAIGWVQAQCALTRQQRANGYVSRMSVAMITASLAGHPMSGGRR